MDSPSNNPSYLRFYLKRGFSSEHLSKPQLSLFRCEYLPSSHNTFHGDPFLALKCETHSLKHFNNTSDDDKPSDDDTCSSSSSSCESEYEEEEVIDSMVE